MKSTNDLKAYKLQNNINNIINNAKTIYPDDIYISEFDVDDFVNGSSFDLKYLPEERRKLRDKLRIFRALKHKLMIYKSIKKTIEIDDEEADRDFFNGLLSALGKYRVQLPEDSFETIYTNEVNSSVISDICSYMVNYACTFEESLDFSIKSCADEYENINIKLKFYDKAIPICKKNNLSITFKKM